MKVLIYENVSFHNQAIEFLLAFWSTSEVSHIPTRSDTNQAVQPHNMARGLKFRI